MSTTITTTDPIATFRTTEVGGAIWDSMETEVVSKTGDGDATCSPETASLVGVGAVLSTKSGTGVGEAAIVAGSFAATLPTPETSIGSGVRVSELTGELLLGSM